ncbi:hypothetical protein JHK82_024162 [Glycine max]|uniref:Uncharacterized protein n=1 Tax=Glycine max TaxID=3847 RepID=A0A0R0I4J8_SOYBN|nr:hypothetical protein JHK85_024726 [Glycine max]KAG5011988.1 hypothetical protein JHK86_024249 [Glycine max]KAG5132974.1 hypothetical protein JHK82_024162 [Glycine max]KAH1041722.1 hypothetical protein GYH30_024198 [Glycine max]KRH37360.1 hypothetical protein GLYMA_09G061400v4 [Glycine max]
MKFTNLLSHLCFGSTRIPVARPKNDIMEHLTLGDFGPTGVWFSLAIKVIERSIHLQVFWLNDRVVRLGQNVIQ